MEDELEAAGGVAANLAAGGLAIVGHADFVGHVFVGELLFGLADEADLGDGVDAVGIEAGVGAGARMSLKARAAAMRPCSMETEAREGKPTTSPTAKMWATLVWKCSSTGMRPRESASRPARPG
jgi:hypothetical protein